MHNMRCVRQVGLRTVGEKQLDVSTAQDSSIGLNA